MGYEVRMLVANAPARDHKAVHQHEEYGLWVYKEADLWLGKLSYDGAYHKLLDTPCDSDERYFFYASDAPIVDNMEYPVTEDPYGDPLRRLDPVDVLEALRKGAEDWGGVNSLHAAAAMLEKFIERGPRYGSLHELIVLHYGY